MGRISYREEIGEILFLQFIPVKCFRILNTISFLAENFQKFITPLVIRAVGLRESELLQKVLLLASLSLSLFGSKKRKTHAIDFFTNPLLLIIIVPSCACGMWKRAKMRAKNERFLRFRQSDGFLLSFHTFWRVRARRLARSLVSQLWLRVEFLKIELFQVKKKKFFVSQLSQFRKMNFRFFKVEFFKMIFRKNAENKDFSLQLHIF